MTWAEGVFNSHDARGGVAQLVRASACHAEGRGFESRRSRHSGPVGPQQASTVSACKTFSSSRPPRSLRTIAASRGLGVAHRGVNLIGRHERSLAAGGGFACRFGASATASPSATTSAPRLKSESKLIPPRDFLKGTTGGSRLARNQVRAKRPADDRGDAHASAKSFARPGRRRDDGRLHARSRTSADADGVERSGQLRCRRPDGRGGRQRQTRGFDGDHLGRQRQRRQVRLPGIEACARPLFACHSCRRL